MTIEVFSYQDYKTYLRVWIQCRPKRGHGVRSAIASALRCQVAYVSQVLNGNAQLALEQAEAFNQFAGHSPEESHFFLLLVQKERAGTVSLKRYFSEQIQSLLQKRVVLKNRLDVKKTLSLSDQAIYYSAWYYAAIHVALSIEPLQTKEALARRFGLPLRTVTSVLEFLCSMGLAVQKSGRYQIGEARIHLADDSPMSSKNHVNWRMRSIEALDKSEDSDLHYSSVVTMSDQDVTKLKAMLVKWIIEAKALIRESKEEDVHCLNLDFFRLKK